MLKVFSAVGAKPDNISKLSAGLGRLRVFTDVFQRALRREFLHTATALHDWDGKIRLLGGLKRAARELVRSLTREFQAFDSEVTSNADDFGRSSRTAYLLSQYYLSLVECFVSEAGEAVSGGRLEPWRHSDRFKPSMDVVNRLTGALTKIAHLESTLRQWQMDLGTAVAATHRRPEHVDIRVSFGWDARSVIDQALETARQSVDGNDAADICLQSRQLFLANYYHAALSPNNWARRSYHERVVDLHMQAHARLHRLTVVDNHENSLIRQCVQSVRWRLDQLQNEFSSDRFLELADHVPNGETDADQAHFNSVDELALTAQKNVQSGELRVLLFGPRNWQLKIERQVKHHVNVISGSRALIQRDDRARGFQRILIHADELNAEWGSHLQQIFRQDPRVLVVAPPRSAIRIREDSPPDWTWQSLSKASIDANWLVAQCIPVMRSRRSDQGNETNERVLQRLVYWNRRESVADLACHVVNQRFQVLYEHSSSAARDGSIVFDQIRNLVAGISDKPDDDHARTVLDPDLFVIRSLAGFIRTLTNVTASEEWAVRLRITWQKDEVCDALQRIESHPHLHWLFTVWLLLVFLDRQATLAVTGSEDNFVLEGDSDNSSSGRISGNPELIIKHGFTKETLLETLKHIAENNLASLDVHSRSLSVDLRLQQPKPTQRLAHDV